MCASKPSRRERSRRPFCMTMHYQRRLSRGCYPVLFSVSVNPFSFYALLISTTVLGRMSSTKYAMNDITLNLSIGNWKWKPRPFHCFRLYNCRTLQHGANFHKKMSMLIFCRSCSPAAVAMWTLPNKAWLFPRKSNSAHRNTPLRALYKLITTIVAIWRIFQFFIFLRFLDLWLEYGSQNSHLWVGNLRRIPVQLKCNRI